MWRVSNTFLVDMVFLEETIEETHMSKANNTSEKEHPRYRYGILEESCIRYFSIHTNKNTNKQPFNFSGVGFSMKTLYTK